MDIAKLGRADLLLLLEFVEQTMVVRDGMEVSAMLRRLCQHVPARGVIAVASVSRMFDLRKTADAPRPKFPAGTEGQVVNTGGLSFLNIGYPEPWLAEYWSKNYFVSDPTKSALQNGAQLLSWADVFVRPEQREGKRYVRAAFDFGIRDGVTVACRPPRDRPRCYFSFLGDDISRNDRAHTILRYLTPYLQEAMDTSVNAPSGTAPRSEPSPLTSRESEVLRWTMEGKTNWEISVILNISERTIKFHVANSMTKLHATSRAHAVAIALRRGFVTW